MALISLNRIDTISWFNVLLILIGVNRIFIISWFNVSMALIGLDRIDTISGLFVMITMITTQNNIVSHTDVDDDDGKSPIQSFSLTR